ncbi:hypothetical protein CAC42_3574 [Sphaceloma murrayae]|uniref:Uncharacterized protein n=1 Tax=Sphaceloma murrayae TaxID=2082308 RepID=A0A2K1QT10_9PEZI|nr:hypothetical protein CAC42_3574 [Sphaceloma murrayae]
MLRLLLLVTALSLHILAQTTALPKVSDDWVQPQWPDGTTLLTSGQAYELRWTANITRWFPGYAPSANVTNVTLWVTGAYNFQYAHKITPFVDLTSQVGTRWIVNIPSEELEATQDWTFRFLPANLTFFGGPRSEQVSSPQLRIRANTTSTSPPARTGPPTTAPSTSVPSFSPTPIPSSGGGLSPGATAGIAIGTAALALLLAGAAWFLLRRRRHRRRRARENDPKLDPAGRAPEMSAYHDNATGFSHQLGHQHNPSNGSDYFNSYGQNSHTHHSGTFSGSTLSSKPGSGNLPAYPMTPGSGAGVLTPGSENHPGSQAGFYAPTPTEKAEQAQQEMGVPDGTVVTPSEMTGTVVERSELEAPLRGLFRDQGAERRRD